MPVVSIILTSYNHAKYLREAIDSVINQTLSDWELFIFDDASTDESWRIIQTYSDPRIRAFRNAVNQGPTFAFNKAIFELAAGSYIAVHHSDDVWEKNKLQDQIRFLKANPNIGAVFSNALAIDERGAPLADPSHFYYDIFNQPNRNRHEWLRFFFFSGNALCHPSVLIRKKCYEDCGPYASLLHQSPDFNMWVRLCMKYEIHVLPERLVRFRVRDSEANTSGSRPETRIRGVYEFYKVLDVFLAVREKTEFFKIFPSMASYDRGDDTDTEFVLAMTAFEEVTFCTKQLFGVDILFRIISDRARARKVQELYGFGLKDFIALTGKYDLFSREEVSDLWNRVQAMDAQIASLNQTVAECDNQIANLNLVVADARRELAQILASKSWKITKPLRFARRVVVNRPRAASRRALSENARALWRALPMSCESKGRLKGLVFKTFPWAFRWSKAYQAWNTFNSPINDAPMINPRGWLPTENGGEYVPLIKASPLEHKPAKLICFYLPQFHAIPENDEWWGQGFTEWTNVQPAQPQFEGHYQPHVPIELGYYDLLDPAVQRSQVELAKLYGIEGFCFYFYWFGGKRLLEAPVENYLNDQTLDLPFCLCWANENWSRRWDGLDSEILMAQQHSVEDDIAFIQHVARYMRDPRYIRIKGKPLLLVYRPSLLPSALKTASRWRDWCRANGVGEIFLAYTQSFEAVDPAKYGFDAAIEFPPNNSAPPNITGSATPIDEDFGSTIYDWRVFVERSEHYQQQPYTLFRSVCPSWDNTARRKNRGTVFLNSTPALYQRWLENAIRDTQARCSNPDEQLIFVNAWNEWAEGAHLEPDARYGYAWLQATRNALSGETYIPDTRRRIVLVAHDGYPHGAQMLAANLAKTLNQGMGFHVDLICLGEGPLVSEYEKWATVHLLAGKDPRGAEAKALARRLHEAGHRTALVNTTVSGLFLETLVGQRIECVALIHELRGVLEQNQLHGPARAIATHARKIVFPAAEVARSFNDVAPVPPGKLVIRPQGLYKRRDKSRGGESDHARLRQKLGLAEDTQIVLGVGYADHRKGIDLFVAAGLAMAGRLPKARWVWIGHWGQNMQPAIERQLAASPDLKDRFIFPGLQEDTNLFYGGADVFALTSREDPFPSVVLEAMDASVPVVGFENAGGFIGLLREGCGRLVEKENAIAFGEAVATLLEQPEQRRAAGARGAELVAERFSFRHYVFDLLDLLGLGLDRISVVVPNYNYAHYLPERLDSILRQDYPIFEVIFLDDRSQDNSLEVAHEILSAQPIDYRIIANVDNSGSVFKQWKKGVDLARGSHVWIAEADDSCSANFLSETRKGFRTPGVVLSYCESRQIDENGQVLAKNYLAYLSDIDARRWLSPFVMDGYNAAHGFCIKNVIPNVSGVLFEAGSLRAVLGRHIERILSYRVAGDWFVYVLLLKQGRVAFTPVPANAHRRHQSSITLGSFNAAQLEEIRGMQAFVANEFPLTAEQEAAARAYVARLAEQFGLATVA